MVKLNKIYTKVGDDGRTWLGNGDRVHKTSLRVEALGDIDELNSYIGLCLTIENGSDFKAFLKRLQNLLFDLGADVSVPYPDPNEEKQKRLSKTNVEELEKLIDHYNSDLAPLDSFILPGGSCLSSWLHIARSISRRVERRLFQLDQQEPLNKNILYFMNRLSDLFFVCARYANNKGKDDILWQPNQK